MDRTRRSLLAAFLLGSLLPGIASAEPKAFDEKAFRAAQEARKPVLVDIYATW